MATASQLPSPTVNTVPRGLLALLGIKNGGQTPQVLSNVLLPTMDLLLNYVQSISQDYGFSTAVRAAGTLGVTDFNAQSLGTAFDLTAGLVVPQNEVWIIPHWSISWVPAAPASDWWVPVVQPTQSTSSPEYQSCNTQDVVPVPGAGSYSRSRTVDGLLFVPSNARLAVYGQFIGTAAGSSCNAGIRIARLQV